ncbi:MAG: AraC family transcriptional regulator [Myxococcales bacterium]
MRVISGQPGADEHVGEELRRLSIPSVYPAQLVLLSARFGVEAEHLLEGTGIERAVLELNDGRITPVSSIALTRRALELTGEPGLGFYYGLQLKLSSHGAVGMLAMTSATLRDAMQVLTRFAALRSPNLRFLHYDEGEHAVLELIDAQPEPALRIFVVEFMFTALSQMARTLLGRPITGSVELAYPEPAYFPRFAHLWPGPARFDQTRHRMLLPRARLDDALQMADSVTAKQIEKECEEELSRCVQPDSFLSDLRRMVLAHPDQFPSLERMAAQRHVSERTLKRQLQAHGTTYRQVVDELKRERAIVLLSNPKLGAQQVGQALGYADPANFHRAFRRWFGVSPDAWRRARKP